MEKLGIMQKVTDLRIIWPHEQSDFSKWLAEEKNLLLLSEAIGIGNIVLEERESKVGDFAADLYAREEGTDRKIIIENQLEETDHNHLGKVITYAAGKGAEIIIWIVKKARDEHKQAIEWLNQHTDENIGFFLLEIELWKINDSLPAPKFNIVESPNDWGKIMKTADNLNETEKLRLNFWQKFKDYAIEQADFNCFSLRKIAPNHWYNLSVGTSAYHIGLTMNTKEKCIGTEIYIPNDKEIFQKFLSQKVEIEKILGDKAEWIEANKACRILVTHPAIFKNNESNWKEYFDWYIKMALKLKQISKEFDN